MDELPFSQAAENNAPFILRELRSLMGDRDSLLEIGAGTGQHALHFSKALPEVRWQPTDYPDALPRLALRCSEDACANQHNLLSPVALDLASGPWPRPWPDVVYTANTLHIVSKALVESLFVACGEHATRDSLLIVYGPFNYRGVFTSPSNADFDVWLKARNPHSGIRDQEWLVKLADEAGFVLERDCPMPANNRLLCWRRGNSRPIV